MKRNRANREKARLISNLDIYKGTFLKSTMYEDVDD